MEKDRHRQAALRDRANRRLMGMAGLGESWRLPPGERVRSFAIITTESNELCAALHNWMPAILAPEAWPEWLIIALGRRLCRSTVVAFDASPRTATLAPGSLSENNEQCGNKIAVTPTRERMPWTVAQRLRQLGVSAIIGQQEDNRLIRLGIAAWSHFVEHRPFAPMRPCFQPKDLRGDIAGLRVGEQIAGHRGESAVTKRPLWLQKWSFWLLLTAPQPG
jgi:SOS response associated peptidase (SRAP)